MVKKLKEINCSLYVYFVLFIFLTILSCTHKVLPILNSVEDAPADSNYISDNLVVPDSILFLFFTIHTDTVRQKTKIDFVELKKVKGKVKGNSILKEDDKYYIEVTYLDENKNRLKNENIEHPLKTAVEYLDENGNFKFVTVNQTQSEFAIRTKFDSKYQFISFKDKNNLLDTTINLFP